MVHLLSIADTENDNNLIIHALLDSIENQFMQVKDDI